MNVSNGLSRRDILKGLAATATIAATGNLISPVSATNHSNTTSNQPPNIVWLIGDDVGARDLGCYGAPIKTPHIDALAKQGMRFENAISTAPSCSPSRAAMYSGLYPHATGIHDHTLLLREDVTLLPTLLKANGYFTAHVNKLHLGPAGLKQFDRNYAGSSQIPTDFSRERPKDKPFFLSVGFTESHRPFDSYPDVGKCAFPKNAIDDPHDPEKVVVPSFLPDAPEVRQELALYYDQIAVLDNKVGKILQWLEDEGLADNTLVLFFSDQGMPFPRCKTSLYDSGIGTALIARLPGRIAAHSIQPGLFSLVDLTHTMLALAGVKRPDNLHGQNLLDMFLHPSQPGREFAYAERNWHCIDDHIRSVRDRRFKYIRNYYTDEPFGHAEDIVRCDTYQTMVRMLDEGKLTKEQMHIFLCPRAPEELYDLKNDPDELHNIAHRSEHQKQLVKMRSALDEWVVKTNDVSPELRWKDRINLRSGEQYLGPNLTEEHIRSMPPNMTHPFDRPDKI